MSFHRQRHHPGSLHGALLTMWRWPRRTPRCGLAFAKEGKEEMTTKLFDSRIVSSAEQALDFIGNILESSTEYSIIGKDLDGKILLWNEGSSRRRCSPSLRRGCEKRTGADHGNDPDR